VSDSAAAPGACRPRGPGRLSEERPGSPEEPIPSTAQPIEWWRPDGGSQAAVRRPAGDAGAPRAAGDLPFAALLAFLFVLVLAPQEAVPALAPLRPGLLTGAMALATHLLDRLSREGSTWGVSGPVAAALALAGWAAVTLPFALWPGGSATVLVGTYLKVLAVFWLLASVVTTRGRHVTVAWALSLMALPLAVSGIAHYRSGDVTGAGVTQRIVGYEAPLTQNPNDLALMLNLILPVTAALFLGRRNPLLRAVLAGLMAVEAAAIIVTFSRAGFLALGTTLTIYAWRLVRRPERRWLVAALLLALAALPLLPSSYFDRLGTIPDIETDPTGSSQARWADTLAATRYALAHPVVGAGIGMDILALNETRGPEWKEVHNVYLQHAVDLGLPGLALFLLILGGSLRAAARVRREAAGAAGERDLFCLAEGLEIALLTFTVAAFFYPVAFRFDLYLVAGLALGIRAAWEGRAERPAPDRSLAEERP
jgi:putative inorganic carbon (HCO3(-)) transporter